MCEKNDSRTITIIISNKETLNKWLNTYYYNRNVSKIIQFQKNVTYMNLLSTKLKTKLKQNVTKKTYTINLSQFYS